MQIAENVHYADLCKKDCTMITTICLLILAYSILRKPVGRLTGKLEDVDWKGLVQDVWDKIVAYSKKAGRTGARIVLRFYYAIQEGGLSTLEKALVYAGIIYIIVPGDLFPRRILGLLGVLDDVAVAAWIYKKIGDALTPDIDRKVEVTLDEWFGPEIVTSVVAELTES